MAWWDKMPRQTQAWLTIISVSLGVLGGAFALGAATSTTVIEVRELPAQMRANALTDSAQDRSIRYLMHIDSQRVAVWDSVRGMYGDVRDIKCILTADIEGTNPARCLSTYR